MFEPHQRYQKSLIKRKVKAKRGYKKSLTRDFNLAYVHPFPWLLKLPSFEHTHSHTYTLYTLRAKNTYIDIHRIRGVGWQPRGRRVFVRLFARVPFPPLPLFRSCTPQGNTFRSGKAANTSYVNPSGVNFQRKNVFTIPKHEENGRERKRRKNIDEILRGM